MTRAIVTGATSFFGKALIQRLLKGGYEIVAVKRPGSAKLTGAEGRENVSVLEVFMEDVETLIKTVSRADVFFHLAWDGTRGADRLDEEKQKNNYVYSMRALKTAVELGCECFVGAGSQAEYGPHDEKTAETTYPTPDTAYGRYKLRFTEDGAAYAKKNGVRFLIPRFYSLYGVGDYEKSALSFAADALIKGEDCAMSPCEQTWNFLHVSDAANAVAYLTERGEEGVFNVASREERRLCDFLKVIETKIGKGTIRFGAKPYPPTGAVPLWPNTDKLAKTGFRELYDFDRGAEEIIAQKREQYERENEAVEKA